MTPAGKRRCRIEIQTYAGSIGPTGAPRHQWTAPGALRWAYQKFVTGNQQDTGTRVTYVATHSFAVPRPTDVGIKDRIKRLPDGAMFDIVAINESQPDEIILMAIEGQRMGS